MKHFLALTLGAILASTVLCAQTPYTKTFSMNDIIPNSAGWSYWFIPTGSVADTLDVKMSCVNIGDAPHGAHSHTHDELFILVEGEAIGHLNGEEHELHVGDCLYCPSGSSHSIRRQNHDSQIRYLMFNRNIKGGIKTPFPFWKETYTIADCYVPFKKNHSFWYLDPKQSLGGMNVRSVFLKGKKSNSYTPSAQQLVIVVLEGSADVTVDGTSVTLPAMSVCYVPRGSACAVRSSGGPLRYLEARSVALK